MACSLVWLAGRAAQPVVPRPAGACPFSGTLRRGYAIRRGGGSHAGVLPEMGRGAGTGCKKHCFFHLFCRQMEKACFFVMSYEKSRLGRRENVACGRKRVRFGEGQGRKRVCFSVFLTNFFFAGLRWVKLDGCTAELPCFASIKGESHVPFPAGQHGRQDLCV